MINLEICVDSVESAIAAELGGAQRIELCSALAEGGLTPSAGLIRAVRARVKIGLFVMVRPRSGDFFYSDDEFAVMQDDIRTIAQIGADGVVLGILTADGTVDVQRTRQLVLLAHPMEVTFHRAFDMTRNLELALEDVIATGAHRILTSGAASNALLGSACIQSLVLNARGRIHLMVGGTVRRENVETIALATGAHDFHAALRTAIPSPVTHQNRSLQLGDSASDEYTRYVVRCEDVRGLRKAIDSAIGRSLKEEVSSQSK